MRTLKHIISICLGIVVITGSWGYGYDSNLTKSFEWAKNNGITTLKTLDSFKPNRNLKLQESSKFLVIFAQKVLSKSLNTKIKCNLKGIDSADSSLKDYMNKACKLGLYNGKINPELEISKADALAYLIILMYGTQDTNVSPWYKNYFEKAKQVGLIFDLKMDGYEKQITRGDFINLLKRASEISSINSVNIDLFKLDQYKKLITTFFADMEYSVLPSFKPTKFPINTKDIINYKDISEKLGIPTSQLEKIKESGYIYLNNNKYANPISYYEDFKTKNIPIFVTIDSVLFINDLLIKRLQYDLEQTVIYDYLWTITYQMYQDSKRYYNAMQGDIKQAAYQNMLMFGVALKLMEPKDEQFCTQKYEELCDDNVFSDADGQKYAFVPDTIIQKDLEFELTLIKSQSSFKSKVFNINLNPIDYNPTGHYASAYKLSNLYKALAYLSNEIPVANRDFTVNTITTYQAFMISNILSKKADIKKKYMGLNGMISYFMAKDSLFGPMDMSFVLDNIYGAGKFNMTILSDKSKYHYIYDSITKIPLSGISKLSCADKGCQIANNIGFSFIGKTKNIKEIYHNGLVASKVPLSSLDLFNAIGSDASASKIGAGISKTYKDKILHFRNNVFNLKPLEMLRNKFGNQIFLMKAILTNSVAGLPGFMSTAKWSNNSIQSAGGLNVLMNSFPIFSSEILEQNLNEPDITENFEATSYVQPATLLYKRMYDSNRMLLSSLGDYGLLDKYMKLRLTKMNDLLLQLYTISKKQLQQEKISKQEYTFIKNISSKFKRILDNIDESSLNMQQIDDGYKDLTSGLYFQYGFGIKLIIVQYTNHDSKKILGVGPVFDYYELKNVKKQTIQDWKSLIKTGKLISPDWLK